MKRIAAALTLFTRLPLWRWIDIPAQDYNSAVVCWPLTGWLTGGLTAGVFIVMSSLLPVYPALVLALTVRLLLTGALHEDGLADLCDGFGGGRDRDSILRIMKDSHIGTYGVIGLICLFFTDVTLLGAIPRRLIALTLFAADPFAKFCASQLINVLPYARPEGAKNKLTYPRMTAGAWAFNLLTGAMPLSLLIIEAPLSAAAIICPLGALAILISMMKRRLGGYTGDCCGATFLICEAAMLLGVDLALRL